MTNVRTSVLCSLACALALQADTLRQNFVTPPDSTKPYMYWYWLNNNASAKGITADLERYFLARTAPSERPVR